jgi:hypothetical protein
LGAKTGGDEQAGQEDGTFHCRDIYVIEK